MRLICRTAILSAEVVCLGFLLMACASPASQSSAPPQPQSQPLPSQQKQYDLKGKVVSVDKAGKTVAVGWQLAVQACCIKVQQLCRQRARLYALVRNDRSRRT